MYRVLYLTVFEFQCLCVCVGVCVCAASRASLRVSACALASLRDSLGRGEQVAAVGGDGVDGALVALQLPQGPQGVCVPQLEHAASAAAQQSRRARHHPQGTHPIAVRVWHLLLANDMEEKGAYFRFVSRTLLRLHSGGPFSVYLFFYFSLLA